MFIIYGLFPNLATFLLEYKFHECRTLVLYINVFRVLRPVPGTSVGIK